MPQIGRCLGAKINVKCWPSQVLQEDSPTAVKRESGASQNRPFRCCPRNGKQVRAYHEATGVFLGRRYVKTCKLGYWPGTQNEHVSILELALAISFSGMSFQCTSGTRGRPPGKGTIMNLRLKPMAILLPLAFVAPAQAELLATLDPVVVTATIRV